MTVDHCKVLQGTEAVSATQTMVDAYGVLLSPPLSTIVQTTQAVKFWTS